MPQASVARSLVRALSAAGALTVLMAWFGVVLSVLGLPASQLSEHIPAVELSPTWESCAFVSEWNEAELEDYFEDASGEAGGQSILKSSDDSLALPHAGAVAMTWVLPKKRLEVPVVPWSGCWPTRRPMTCGPRAPPLA